MISNSEFLCIVFVFFAVLSILYIVLGLERAMRLDSWFHILGQKRKNYNFVIMTKRKRAMSYYFTVISAMAIALSYVDERIGTMFVWLFFISMAIAIFYLQPVKKI